MKAINIPTLQPVPFATNAASGNKRSIPATQPAGSPGAASYDIGFPPETMQPIASGGTPPYGQDFNGLFFDVTNELRWAQAGGTYVYNSAFSASIGGYPAGAVLKSASSNVLWINTTDDNTTDPDSSGAAGWIAFRSNSGSASLAVVSGDITPSKLQLGSSLISITGDATGLTSTLRLPLTAGASYLVNNATTGSSATLNVQGATGAGITIAQGQAAVVFTDGTNYYTAGSSGAGQYLPINGTAVAATKLATARTFNLSGVITTAAVNFDGTGNVTLTTAIADGTLSIAKTNGLQTALDGKLGLGGGTLTGSLAINANGNQLILNKSASGQVSNIASQTAGSFRWVLQLGDNSAESGGNNGSNLAIQRYSDTGTYIDSPFFINRATGQVTFSTTVNVGQGLFSTTAALVLGPNGAGTVYIRPNGSASTAGQVVLANTGSLSLSGAVQVQTGAVGTQQILTVFGWNNNIGRIKEVIEADASYSIYTYDSVGGSANQALNLTNAGSMTIRGNFTAAGTGNFQGSDARLKENVRAVAPRPLHRRTGFVSYIHKDSGAHARGSIAQSLLLAGGSEYVSTFQHKDGVRYSVNYAGAAWELSQWAANEVDKVRRRACLERWVLGGLLIAVLLAKVL
jgi:hypothetical protein